MAVIGILALSIGCAVAKADDPQREGKSFGPCMGKTGRFETVSEILGLTPEEIKAQLQDGKTLADIAAAQGFSQDDLKDAMLAAATEQLYQKVVDGTITQEQADQVLQRMQKRIGNGRTLGP